MSNEEKEFWKGHSQILERAVWAVSWVKQIGEHRHVYRNVPGRATGEVYWGVFRQVIWPFYISKIEERNLF